MTQPKIIHIMRHAKADAGDGRDDYSRTLSPRGEAEARQAADALIAKGVAIDQLIASAAPRAAQTADIVADALSIPLAQQHLQDHLYAASHADWLDALCDLPETCRQVLLVGHNPVLEDLGRYLGHEQTQLPPSGIVALAYSGKWEDLAPNSAKWQWAHDPKK